MQVNEIRVVAVGTVLWGLAFLALLPLKGTLDRHGSGWWLWVCVAGVGLGLIGLRLVARHRAAQRRGAPRS